MRLRFLALPLLLVVASAGCGDDGDTSTTDAMTSASTSDQPGSTGSESGDTTAGPVATTGDDEDVCLTCDPATEYCHESIIDGPSEFSCRPVPPECAEMVDCECIVPLACSESLQACNPGPPVTIECVEG